MADDQPATATPDGSHWGTNTQDWADIQEHTIHPAWLAVLNELTPAPEELLLDLGSGAGGFTQLAARQDVKVTGLDASTALVDIARTRNPTETFRVGDMENLPFPDAGFSAVTAFNSLHFAHNPAKALAEATRVTRPGGHIAVSTWGPLIDCDALVYFLDLGGLMPHSPSETELPEDLSDPATIRRLLSGAGLTITRERTLACPWEYPDLATALRGLLSTGPAAAAINHAGLQRVTDTITESISPYRQADGTYLLHNTCSIVTAART